MTARALRWAALLCALLCAMPAAGQTAAHKAPSKKAVRHTRHPAVHSAHPAGIAPQRAAQIQQALVRIGYLDHTSGRWDVPTIAALTRYQHDHRWQVRFVPDARALIALGLGPETSTQPVARLH